jgi:oxygen-dependent protoporphyrinogen oxidase
MMRVLTDRVGSVPTDEGDRGDQRSVAVVGAGITGLVAAYELRRRGVNVTLYESSAHAGGVIRTSRQDGFIAEHGPNSFMTSPAVDALLTQLDLHRDIAEANPLAKQRFVVRDGTLLPVPMSPPALLATRLFSMRAKCRLLLEPLIKAGAADGDESVASFIRRRLGPEILQYAVDPFVSGVYAGDPETLSMAHAFPRLFRLETEFGSLAKGMLAAQRAGRHAAAQGATSPPEQGGAVTPGGASAQPRLVSFANGMGTLTEALEASLVGTLKLGTPVRLLHRNETRWVVEAGPDGASRTRAVDAVVMATPAHVMAAMELPAALRRHATPVERIEYAPVSTLTLGFRRSQVAHPLDGFGMLMPAVERRGILGALFNSTLFPNRAPDDHVTITCFVGGARHPARAREGTELLVARALEDLRELLGVRGQPVFTKHVCWPRAIPQYSVGYGAVKEAADTMEFANPGLYLAGNYRSGVAVGDCIGGGQRIAERVVAYLTRAG